MNLRKKIKRRTFYDDQDYHDPNQAEVYRAPPKPVKSAYTGKVIEFNPQLRPAVFPTIPLAQVVEEPKNEASGPDLSESPNTEPINQLSRITSPTPDTPVQSVDSLPEQPDQRESVFDVSSMSTSIDKVVWARKLTMPPERTPSPTYRTRSNRPENPVFENNMALMEKLSERTDEEWAAAEMATSDEDEDDEPCGRHMANLSKPAWNHLPLALQLDLVDSVDERHKSLNETFKALRLKPRQKAAMLEQLQKRNQYLDAEESVIASLHKIAEHKFLTGSKKEIDRFINGGYQRQMKKQLFVVDSKIDYLTSTGKEVALAKAYLKTCGIKPEVLDHWTNVLEDGDDEETPVEPTETVQSPIPAPRSPMVSDSSVDNRAPLPAALPTMANMYRKSMAPRKAMKASNRSSEDQEMSSVSRPAQPNARLSKQPGKEPYQIPPLAAPFWLPPQLSTQRQAWLPDAPPADATTKDPKNKQGLTIQDGFAIPPPVVRTQSGVQDPTEHPSMAVHGHRRPLSPKKVLDPNGTSCSINVSHGHDGNVLLAPDGESHWQKVNGAYEELRRKIVAAGQPTPQSPTRDPRTLREARGPAPSAGEMSQDYPKRSGSMVPIKRPAAAHVAYGVVRGTNPAEFQYPGQPSLGKPKISTAMPSGASTQQPASSMSGPPDVDADYQAEGHTINRRKRTASYVDDESEGIPAKSRKELGEGGRSRQARDA